MTKRLIRSALEAVFCGVLLLVSGAAPSLGQSGTLFVQVVQQDGAPIVAVGVTARLAADTTVTERGSTDELGRVVFRQLPAGRYRVIAERLGFERTDREVVLARATTVRLEVVMRPRVLELPDVLVEAERRRTLFEEAAGATVAELTQRDLKLLPGFAESDVLRAMEVLPGVVSTSDFSSSFNVRGGSADQNLILLDGLPIYNPFHLGGLFSVFNSDMISRAVLLTGGFPAQHGGRVSAVLNVESDAGAGGLDVHSGVSVLAARVALGTSLPDDALNSLGLESGRVRMSARRSYFDQLLRPFFEFPYHLTDLQLFGDAWTRGGSRITVTGYTGRDVLDLAGTESFPLQVLWDWGNTVVGSTWATPLGGGRELEVRGGHTRFSTAIAFPEFGDIEIRSRIHQTLLRADLTLPAEHARWRVGAALDRLAYDNLAQAAGAVFAGGRSQGWLLGSYAQATWRPGRWLLETGARADAWLPSDHETRVVVQPRLAVKRFLGTGDVAVRVAAGRYAQFLHSLRDEELPLGIDVWVLSGARAPAVISDQIQLGVEGFTGGWYGAVETYYRRFEGVTTNNFAEDPNDPLDDLISGAGRSYGADFHVRRERGTLRPMIAVSWLKAWREFPDHTADFDAPPIVRYAPVFDRRLDVDVVLQAALPRRYELGLRWNLGTGLPYTRPVGGYTFHGYSTIDGRWRPPDADGSSDRPDAVALGPRNRARYPVYHRLDAGVRRMFVKRWGTVTPYVDVLNVYNRHNVLFYFYQYDQVPATRAGLSMFPVLPTAGVEMRF